MRKKPEGEQVEFLRGMVDRIVRDIVEHEEMVRIDCKVAPARVVLTVFVMPSDMGLVLGNEGANANAIRRLVWTACKKTSLKCDIDFFETTHG